MKIIVVHTFYKLSGGEDTVVQNEIDLLRENGHDVQLLQFKNDGNSLLKILLSPFNISSYFKTKKFIKNFKPDLIHVHNLHFAASASVIHAAHKMGIPIVATLHNYRFLCPSGTLYFNRKMFLSSLNANFPWEAIKLGVYRNSKPLTLLLAISNLIQHKIKTFDKVNTFVVLGEHAKQLFTDSHFKKYQQKFVVKPNFSPLSTVSAANDTSYFLFVGRLTKEKGVETLLKAFADTSIPLRIIGSGELSDEIVAQCKLHKNITYLGQQPPHVVNKHISGAEALVFPSEWYETFGMVLTEAFSKSVPAIVSNLGNIKTIVEDGKTGLTFEPGNDRDLLNKITHYNNLPDNLKAQFKLNAQNAYKKYYTPEVNYEKLIGIYDGALSSKA